MIKQDKECRQLASVASTWPLPVPVVAIQYGIFRVQSSSRQPCRQVPQTGRNTRPGCRWHSWEHSFSVSLLFQTLCPPLV